MALIQTNYLYKFMYATLTHNVKPPMRIHTFLKMLRWMSTGTVAYAQAIPFGWRRCLPRDQLGKDSSSLELRQALRCRVPGLRGKFHVSCTEIARAAEGKI